MTLILNKAKFLTNSGYWDISIDGYEILTYTHSGQNENQTIYTLAFDNTTTCDILIIGGGGGGGRYAGGGGGAGGLILLQKYELEANTDYNLAVGIGGDGNPNVSASHDRNGGKPGYDSYIKKSDNTNEFIAKGGGGGSIIQVLHTVLMVVLVVVLVSRHKKNTY